MTGRPFPRHSVGVVAVTAIALAACGNAASGTTEGVGATPATGSAQETAPQTRTIVDFRGEEVEVPANPERVVTFDVTPTLNLALLGLDPLTAPLDMEPSFDDDFRRFAPQDVDLESYQVVGFPAELNVEAVAALEPDLIMGFSEVALEDPAFVERLERIAPTVLYDFGTNADWRERFHLEAEILGRTDEARALEVQYEEAAAAAAESAVPPLAFVRLEVDGGGTWRLEDPDSSIPGSVIGDTGLDLFQPPPDVGERNDNQSYYPDISGERLDILDGAGALVVQDLSTFGQEDPLGQFAENPLWQRLPAVEQGDVTTLPALVFNGGTYASGILTIEAVVDAFGQ